METLTFGTGFLIVEMVILILMFIWIYISTIKMDLKRSIRDLEREIKYLKEDNKDLQKDINSIRHRNNG